MLRVHSQLSSLLSTCSLSCASAWLLLLSYSNSKRSHCSFDEHPSIGIPFHRDRERELLCFSVSTPISTVGSQTPLSGGSQICPASVWMLHCLSHRLLPLIFLPQPALLTHSPAYWLSGFLKAQTVTLFLSVLKARPSEAAHNSSWWPSRYWRIWAGSVPSILSHRSHPAYCRRPCILKALCPPSA